MEAECAYRLVLSTSSIEWILAQLNPPPLRFFPDSFQPASSELLDEILQEGRLALETQGLLVDSGSGLLTLDSTVAGLAGVLGFADRTLVVSIYHERDIEPEVWRYYSVEGLLVEQAMVGPTEVALTALRDRSVLHHQVWECLGLRDQPQGACATFRCDAASFSDIPYTLAGDGESFAAGRLVDLGADPGFAGDLISAMASPLWQATLQVVALDSDRPEGIRTLAKLVVLEGVYGIWAISTNLDSDPETVEIAPCNADQARTLVEAVVDKLLN